MEVRRDEIARMENQFVNGNPCVQKWLREKALRSKGTARQYSNKLYHYYLWLRGNKNIKEMQSLLDEHKRLKMEGEEYVHLNLAKEYLLSGDMALKSLNTRGLALAVIRSFYEENDCPLPQKKINLRITEVDRTRAREQLSLKPMTLTDFEKLIAPMKIREKALIVILLQSGMGEGEFVNQFNVCKCRKEWLRNNGHVCEPSKIMRQLREGRERIKIEFVGRKLNSKPYFTFIGKDAVGLLKRYLKFREALIIKAQDRVKMYESKIRKGKALQKWEADALQSYRRKLQTLTPQWQDGQPIFVSNWLSPINEAKIQRDVLTYKKLTGLTDRDFTAHTCRGLFKTECAHRGVDDTISEYFIGHSLDTLGYNRLDQMHPEDFETEYQQVEPALNIISHEGTELDRKEVERLRKENVGLKDRLTRLETVLIAMAKAQKPEITKQIEEMLRDEETTPHPKSQLRLPKR